jgi:hypothetical protein
MSPLQQAASSLRIGPVNGSSWSTRVSTSACTPTGSFRDAKNGPTTNSVLMALPSTPMDGCLSASTWVYVGISRGGSSWPMSQTPSLVLISSPISASWWTAETTDYWTESRRYPYRPKPPARWSQASRPSPGAHRSTASSPNSGTSSAQPESARSPP